MPPEVKRINHSPAVLDFGDGRGNVLSLREYSNV